MPSSVLGDKREDLLIPYVGLFPERGMASLGHRCKFAIRDSGGEHLHQRRWRGLVGFAHPHHGRYSYGSQFFECDFLPPLLLLRITTPATAFYLHPSQSPLGIHGAVRG